MMEAIEEQKARPNLRELNFWKGIEML